MNTKEELASLEAIRLQGVQKANDIELKKKCLAMAVELGECEKTFLNKSERDIIKSPNVARDVFGKYTYINGKLKVYVEIRLGQENCLRNPRYCWSGDITDFWLLEVFWGETRVLSCPSEFFHPDDIQSKIPNSNQFAIIRGVWVDQVEISYKQILSILAQEEQKKEQERIDVMKDFLILDAPDSLFE